MSFPTDQFGKLTLGNMPTTRAQSSRMSQATRGTDEPDSDSEDDSPKAPSQLIYVDRDLSPGAKERLERAFFGRFSIEVCDSKTDAEPRRGQYFVFQLGETTNHTVRIRVPAENYNNIECSNCNEPQPCRHVFWLLDQINKYTLTNAEKRGRLTLSKRGYPSELPGPFERISRIGIDELAKKAQWKTQESRAAEIQEMLAALSPKTAEKFRPDIFDRLSEDQSFDAASFEPALARRDLTAFVARSLMVNQDMFRDFRAVITPSHCAADFFRKMREEADASVSHMAKYLGTGVIEENSFVPDIPWCARRLIEIVASIRSKVFDAYLSKTAKAEAANTLVHILNEVVNRNEDAYAGRVWEGRPERKIPDREKNLFHRVIVSPVRTADDPFIIDVLSYLTDTSQHLVDRMEVIGEVLERMEVIGEQMPKGGAPSTYTAKFRELILRMKRDLASGPKRPGDEMQSDSKRMK
jgi:hypothetical protein